VRTYWKILNLRKEVSMIENYYCIIEHNWNPIDWDHFHPEIRDGWVELRKSPLCISRWGQVQLNTIKAQLIPDGSASKIAMVASVSPAPPTIFGVRVAQLSTIKSSQFDPQMQGRYSQPKSWNNVHFLGKKISRQLCRTKSTTSYHVLSGVETFFKLRALEIVSEMIHLISA